MDSEKDIVTMEDVRFLLLRVVFWIFFLCLVFWIHLDAKKETEIKKQTKEKNDRLPNSTEHP